MSTTALTSLWSTFFDDARVTEWYMPFNPQALGSGDGAELCLPCRARDVPWKV
jgi:hypothetical protein